MSSRLLSPLLLLALLAPGPALRAEAADKRPVTPDDALHLRTVGSPTISPDGARVLFTVRAWEWPNGTPEPDKGTKAPEARAHVWIAPSSGSEPARQLTSGEKGESAPAWSPDGKFISFIAARAAGGAPAAAGGEDGPKSQIWLMRADGGEAWALTEAADGVLNGYEWSADSTRIAFIARDAQPKAEADARKRKDDARVAEEEPRKQHLWVIDVATRKAQQITSGTTFNVTSPSWSPDGARIAFVSKPTMMIRDERADLMAVTVATKAIETIAASTGAEAEPAWSPDGKTIAYTLLPFNDAKTNADGISTRPLFQAHLMLYDVAAKQSRDAAEASFDYAAGGPTWTPDGKRLLLNVGDRAYRSMFSYDVASRRYARLTKDQMIGFGSQSKDGSKIAYTLDSPAAPGDVFVAAADFSGARKLSTANPEAADFLLGETEVITWKSTDGWPVEGVLVKPVGFQAGKKYPLLVDVHGGPTGAHTNGYKVGVRNGGQLWAGRGWAVLYPNPRGSTNYGEKFMRGNLRDWGGGDYRDIMTGVDELIARGVADPDRLALMGWSYGGYMTSWVVSQTTRFKAARMGAGLSDLYSMYGTTDIPGYIGTFFDNYPTAQTMALYRERSAMSYVDKVTTPLLIMHGANDERVPIGQPMQFYRALKDRGRTVELIWYPREGHGIAEYYHQRDQVKRELDWMTTHVLGAAAAPSGGAKSTSQP